MRREAPLVQTVHPRRTCQDNWGDGLPAFDYRIQLMFVLVLNCVFHQPVAGSALTLSTLLLFLERS